MEDEGNPFEDFYPKSIRLLLEYPFPHELTPGDAFDRVERVVTRLNSDAVVLRPKPEDTTIWIDIPVNLNPTAHEQIAELRTGITVERLRQEFRKALRKEAPPTP